MFDLLVGLVLIVSAGVGLMRGATRELVAVVSLVAAVALAVLSLRVTGPLAQRYVETAWLARALAMLVVFVLTYVGLRLAGLSLSKRVHATPLGAVDRAIGVGFGLVRAFVVLGVFNLVFHAATPPERTPHWVMDAKLYPLTRLCADALRALAPKGVLVRDRVAPAFEKAVADGIAATPPAGGDKAMKSGYSPASLKQLDDLVEKSH